MARPTKTIDDSTRGSAVRVLLGQTVCETKFGGPFITPTVCPTSGVGEARDRVLDLKTGQPGYLLTLQKSKWASRDLCLVQLDSDDLPVNPVVRWADELKPVRKLKA